MPKLISGTNYYSAKEVAEELGIHRLTLLRWIREGKVPDAPRDRNGWRVFPMELLLRLRDYATSVGETRPDPFQPTLGSILADGVSGQRGMKGERSKI